MKKNNEKVEILEVEVREREKGEYKTKSLIIPEIK